MESIHKKSTYHAMIDKNLPGVKIALLNLPKDELGLDKNCLINHYHRHYLKKYVSKQFQLSRFF